MLFVLDDFVVLVAGFRVDGDKVAMGYMRIDDFWLDVFSEIDRIQR